MTASSPSAGDQACTPLLDALRTCAQTHHAAFYTPGHKRGRGILPELRDWWGPAVFQADLPELPDLDNLFAPQSVIQQAQALAADAFGADRTWFLTNGSTSGVIAAILATCRPGDKLVLPRNVHQSAIAGLILAGVTPIFASPDYDRNQDIAHSLTPAAVQSTLATHPDAKAVLIVRPTYYGVCGDVATIAAIAHQHGIPLIVDEAHGPHLAFHPDLPVAALAAGADLVVQSTHKVLSALTQAAMLHRRGDRVADDRVSKALQIVQSTSPNYLLLASLDAARYQMATEGQSLLTQTLALADHARSQIDAIPGLATLNPDQAGTTPGFAALDRTRLTVTVTALGIDGFTADTLLHEQLGVTAELPSPRHLTFIVSLGNTSADIDRLISAFRVLADKFKSNQRYAERDRPPVALPPMPVASPSHSPRAAFFADAVAVPIEQAIHRISTELVCPYPPGIPVLLPGECITAEAIAYLQTILQQGGVISGCADPTLMTLRVVSE